MSNEYSFNSTCVYVHFYKDNVNRKFNFRTKSLEMFKETFKYYKSKTQLPDFSTVIDFDSEDLEVCIFYNFDSNVVSDSIFFLGLFQTNRPKELNRFRGTIHWTTTVKRMENIRN